MTASPSRRQRVRPETTARPPVMCGDAGWPTPIPCGDGRAQPQLTDAEQVAVTPAGHPGEPRAGIEGVVRAGERPSCSFMITLRALATRGCGDVRVQMTMLPHSRRPAGPAKSPLLAFWTVRHTALPIASCAFHGSSGTAGGCATGIPDSLPLWQHDLVDAASIASGGQCGPKLAISRIAHVLCELMCDGHGRPGAERGCHDAVSPSSS
jgi:hypothetical protein